MSSKLRLPAFDWRNTPDIAQRLASYFDTSPQFWMDLQASHGSKLARREPKGSIAR